MYLSVGDVVFTKNPYDKFEYGICIEKIDNGRRYLIQTISGQVNEEKKFVPVKEDRLEHHTFFISNKGHHFRKVYKKYEE
jgi:hypothetical protein